MNWNKTEEQWNELGVYFNLTSEVERVNQAVAIAVAQAQAEVRGLMEQRIKEFEFPTETDYGCDGDSKECCGNCSGEYISADKTRALLLALLTPNQQK